MKKYNLFHFSTIRNQARELRKNMTREEKLLWEVLRNRRLSGYKFLRQHPVVYKGDLKRLYYFIADFYCREKNAIIELDGPIHDKTVEYDEFRDSELKERGYNILRIKNEEVENILKVKEKILDFLNSL